ncbi:MAG: ABC transporter substrate-binding protein [Aminobacterium sp.]|nr:ABC transporter substrate-binding protein [Aminobacterium sp.]MDD4227783.1 ABC transporter substrate-binding protein [Aminobacterium sp.]
MKKKMWIALLAALVCVFAVSGAFAEPQTGGILRWRLINDPPSLDPVFSNITVATRGSNLYLETLVTTSADGQKILPLLAESWEVNEDASVWTFHLRKGVHFHKAILGEPTLNGGREMTAEDVKYSFERLVKMKAARVFFASSIAGFEELNDGKVDEWSGIKVLDKYTVQFTLKSSFAPFLAVLTYPNFGVLPKEDAEKWGKEFTFHPVGTGPFILEKWDHDSLVSFKKNPDYWRKDANGKQLPYLDGVDLIIIPDNSVAYLEFKKGNIDVLPDIPDEYYNEIKEEFGDKFQEIPGLNVQYYGMNQTKAPFDNVKVRQALNYAINREAINELVLNGRYAVAKGVLPPGMPAYNPDMNSYTYNPEKAKELLKEAGYDKGFEVTLHYNNNPRHKAIGEAVQAQLAELGIKMNLSSSEVGAHYDAVRRGDYGLFRAGWAGDYVDPDNFLYTLFYSGNIGPQGNYSRYKNSEVDQWLVAARQETDHEKRVELYKKAEQKVVDDAVWLFLFYSTNSLVAGPNVENIHLDFLGDYMTKLTQVYLAK